MSTYSECMQYVRGHKATSTYVRMRQCTAPYTAHCRCQK